MFDRHNDNIRTLMAQDFPTADLIHDSSVDETNAQSPDAAESANVNDLENRPVLGVVRPAVELRYRISGINIDNSGVLLSDTFGKLASLMQRHVIKDFSLVRTNLEQVFINFAKF